MSDDIALSLTRGPAGAKGRTLHRALGKLIQHGRLEVTYPDGTPRAYGDLEEEPAILLQAHKYPRLRRLVMSPAMEVGEAYMRGDIDFEDPFDTTAPPPIDRLIEVVAQNTRHSPLATRLGKVRHALRAEPNRPQDHYDISNDFYRLWLDRSMTYSCAYWGDDPHSMTLEQAQQNKLHHILRKLALRPGMRLLDIGSGWGQLLLRAAEEYGVEGLGITLSKEQWEASREEAELRGLSDRVRFALMDYRDLARAPGFDDVTKRFDRVVSVGMYEHIGRGNQAQYFAALDRLLKAGGVTVLHTIAQQHDRAINQWVDHYIFPGGNLPTQPMVLGAALDAGFRTRHLENLRQHYALTLDEWLRRFEQSLPQVRDLFAVGKIKHKHIKDVEQFIRAWRFYLATASGSFRYAHLDLLQFVMTKGMDNDEPLTLRHIYR